MPGISYEIPILNQKLKQELHEIKRIINIYTSTFDDMDTGDLDKRLDRLYGVIPEDIIQSLEKYEIDRYEGFKRVFKEFLLPDNIAAKLRQDWEEEEKRAEEHLNDFVFNYLVKNFMSDENGDSLPHHYEFKVEGRCPLEECEGHVSSLKIRVNEPITENEFYYGESGTQYFPVCDRDPNMEKHNTMPISSVNIIKPKSLEGTLVEEIHWRLKSGGRLVDKFVEYFRRKHGGINDVAAALVVGQSSGNLKEDKILLVDDLFDTIMEKFYEHPAPWDPDTYDYYNINEDLTPKHESGETYSLKSLPKFLEAILPYKGLYIGLHLQLPKWDREMELDPDIGHSRYVEQEEEKRDKEWTKWDHTLREYLEPVFDTTPKSVQPDELLQQN